MAEVHPFEHPLVGRESPPLHQLSVLQCGHGPKPFSTQITSHVVLVTGPTHSESAFLEPSCELTCFSISLRMKCSQQTLPSHKPLLSGNAQCV